VHSTKNLQTNYLPDESFKLVILKDQFCVGNLNGEIKIFDLCSMMLLKIIYAYQGNITHLLAGPDYFLSIGHDFTSRSGLHAQLKIF
jgi:hypothetical protein